MKIENIGFSDILSVLTFLATMWLALIARSFSNRSARQQIRQNINDQLKTFNLAILQNEQFAQYILKSRFPPDGQGHDLDFVRSLSVVHYRLNLLCDLYYADKEGIFKGAKQQYEFEEWVKALVRAHGPALEFVLSGKTLIGHPAEFIKEIRKNIAKNAPAATPLTAPTSAT